MLQKIMVAYNWGPQFCATLHSQAKTWVSKILSFLSSLNYVAEKPWGQSRFLLQFQMELEMVEVSICRCAAMF